MKLKHSSFCLGLLICITACISAFFSISHETDLAMGFYAIAALMLVFLGKFLIGNYSNFTVVFLVFSALYSLSGPIAVVYGGGIYDSYPTPYLVDEFLVHYSLAVIGMAVGLILIASIKSHSISAPTLAPKWNSRTLLLLACAFALAASFAEIVNFLRVGGLETLYAGKAAYQSAVSELPGTLPSQVFMLLSTALIGLAFSISNTSWRLWKRRFAIWFMCSAPFILSFVVLGDRHVLLSIIMIFTIGCLFFRPVKEIEFKWIVFGLFIYLTMGFLYGIRAYLGDILTTGDLSILTARISESTFLPTVLNPASNDFACVFGNFNTYILSGESHLRFGETYLRDMTVPIPRLIWPDKPQTAWVDFRDTYFPEMALLGVGGGTAYSSVLEAYINFGAFGVFIVYLLVVLAMGYLERIRSQSRSLMFAVFYLTLLPTAITFHRSDLGNPIFWPLLLAFVGSCSYILINSIIKHKLPIRVED